MMSKGSTRSDLAPGEALDRLVLAMAAGNFEILRRSPDGVDFRHGSYLAQSAVSLPKSGTISVFSDEPGCRVDYEIGVSGFAKYWIGFLGVAFCWLVFPAVIAYRALFYHPDRLMRNLLQCIR